jgi:hypothetical protein
MDTLEKRANDRRSTDATPFGNPTPKRLISALYDAELIYLLIE